MNLKLNSVGFSVLNDETCHTAYLLTFESAPYIQYGLAL
ncbi:hypothetical protein RU86_GL001521 [Lactococcus piscium]|uniref:Uncharacterized protein n=1 Tax=Pseudolactococcus piscium TaxID=1364 RepID=A0A2A5S4T5_9LACT|nr:hypothetical protein RU86_GL001521 [Lactococcus piscium]